MKLAYIVRGSGISGGQRVIHEHLQRLHKRGHDVALVTLNGDKSFWLEHDYPVEGVEWCEEADIVVATSWPTVYPVNSMPVTAKKCYLVQGRESLFLDAFQIRMVSEAEWTYRLPLHVITIAPWLQRMLLNEYEREVDFVANGVNEAFNAKVEPMPREKKYVVLVEGTGHSMAKDYYIMSKAVVENLSAELREETEVWLFTHDKQYIEHLEDSVDKVFTQPKQEDIPRIYAGADVLLKCSRYEGAPCPIVEAMACGAVPVVALIRHPESGEWFGAGDIRHDENALLSEYGDVNTMVSNVELLLTDAKKRGAMRKAGIKYVADHLQWEPLIDELEAAYGRILSDDERWNTAQENEALWWKWYVQDELRSPSFSVFLGHRRQQLKDALRKFGFWKDDNYQHLPAGGWLDAGSGPVSLLHDLPQAQVIAVDPLMEAYASELATVCSLGNRDNVVYQAKPMEEAEPVNGYDGVWCYNVLDHTGDWKKALGNLVTVLRKGGQLWLMTHCRPPHRLDLHHTQSYSAGDVMNFLHENGMKLQYQYSMPQIGTNLSELYVIAVRQEVNA